MLDITNLLRPAMDAGWRFSFDISDWGCGGSAWCGDTNCPHRKQYDPNDGHGFSAVTTEDDEDTYSTQIAVATRLLWLIAQIKPGESL